jgi:RNA recognition motif-containing protein
MSLFISNLSHSLTREELKKIFGEFGNCRVEDKGNYAFVHYSSYNDAEKAVENLNRRYFGNRAINVEWSNSSKNNRSRCYNCGSKHHDIKNCDKDLLR